VLTKNDDFYDAASVIITQGTSLFIGQGEAWTRYQGGELDTIAPPPSALETIKSSPTYSPQLKAFPRPCVYYYGFSHDVEPFDDPQVRAAFASAIDRPRLIREVEALTGDEFPAVTLTPPGNFGHVDGYSAGIGRPFSPTLAQDLLAASGYTGTPTITLMFNVSPHHQAIAEAVRDMWIDTLGITVTLESIDWGAYLDLLRNGSAEERPGIWRFGWCNDLADAHNTLPLFAEGNRARYESLTYNGLLAAAAGETDTAERLALYEEAEATLVMTDTAIAPIYHYAQHRLSRPDLERTYHPFNGQQHLDEWGLSGELRPLELAWGSPSSLDPALAWNDYVEQLFLGLTDFDEQGNVMPELATGWDVSADATVYTFTMRGDATWTDGNPVTAYDVEYGVLRSLDPATGAGYLIHSLYIIENASEYNQANISDPTLVGVEALDATHVRFTLNNPAAYFPAVAALPQARPQPQWAIEAHGCGWPAPEHIVSNGPYELAAWEGGPYLTINKDADGDPIAGGTLTFHVDYQNAGPGAAEDTVVTDTMMGGLTYITDTAPVTHTGSGQQGDPLVWDLGTVAAHSCGGFDVKVQVIAAPSTSVSNWAEIATSDSDDQGESWEKESGWHGEVEGTSMSVHYGQDRAAGIYPVGHTFWVTVTDDVGTVKATATAVSEPGGSGPDGAWGDGFVVEGDDWSTAGLDITALDRVHFRSEDGYTNTLEIGTIAGQLDSAADTAQGTITVPWLAGQKLYGLAGSWGFTFREFEVDLDGTGTGDYFVDFSPDDLLGGQDIDVFYIEPDGDRVGNQIRPFNLNVNYRDDWVEGSYEPGHTVWITVTDQSGADVKGTAVLTTGAVPWWGGQTGFSTNWQGWETEQPDIVVDDRVLGRLENGTTSTVRIGTITGHMNPAADTIEGTVHASWFTETLNGACGVWVENGPWHNFTVDPDGGSYACDFGAEWDLLPEHDVAVQYQEPDGDWVINAFRMPYQVYVPLVMRSY
jgi:oligopeptide transport system substrate-binding protein